MPETAAEIYAYVEKFVIRKAPDKLSKAERARRFIKDFIRNEAPTERKLLVYALHAAFNRLNPDYHIDRAYFDDIVMRAWEVELDGNDVLWILVKRPKLARTKRTY